jgi:vacuolar-type H+-ATPase subunit H
MKKKEKILKEIIKTQMEDAEVLANAIPAEEDAKEAVEEAAEEETTIVSIYRMWNVSIVARRATILLTTQSQ